MLSDLLARYTPITAVHSRFSAEFSHQEKRCERDLGEASAVLGAESEVSEDQSARNAS